MYKARLAAPFHTDESRVYPEEMTNEPSYAWIDSQMRWRTIVERESDKQRNFESQMEYLYFQVIGKTLDALNQFVRDRIRGLRRNFCDEVVYGILGDDARDELPHFWR